MNEKMKLYKACKHQVNTYQADCGMTLVEMWEMVKHSDFWKYECLQDYAEYIGGKMK